ncbi:MAG: outer membrane protein [Xanthobacteraceae bacterium]
MLRKLLLGAAGALAIVGVASAADLPVRGPVYMAAPAPVFYWTGFYGGVHVGYGWGDSQHTFAGASVTPDIDGFTVGGQIGYNWQYAPNWVFGIETDIAWSDISGSTVSPGPAFTSGTNINWYGTTRLRLGYAVDNALFFLAGGVAYGQIERDDTGPAGAAFSDSKVKAGWTLGAGVEVAYGRNWSIRAEYLYVDLGTASFSAPAPFSDNTVDAQFSVVRAALNYRF